MPTNTEPVQYDSFPEKWDAAHASRVLESSIRRVLESRQAPPKEAPAPAPRASSDECCIQAWAFGPGGGRA